MKIRVPRGIRKDQIYIVLILGTGTGIYNWNNLLKEHMKEREKELQLNEVIKRIQNISLVITYTPIVLIEYIS